MNGDSDERTIYVRNLDEKVTKEILEELFVQVGTVASVFLKDTKPPPSSEQTPQQQSMQSRGNFAFIEFQDEESVLFAVEMMDDIELFGKRIAVAPRDRSEQAAKYRAFRDQFRDTRSKQSPNCLNPNQRHNTSNNSYNNNVRTPGNYSHNNNYNKNSRTPGNYSHNDGYCHQEGRRSEPRQYGSMHELYRHQQGGGKLMPLHSTPVMQAPYAVPYHIGGSHQSRQQGYQDNRQHQQHHKSLTDLSWSKPPNDRRQHSYSYNNNITGRR